jgi:precorrin-2 dehydrogenase/sirohydrochlorin ferrochelatase
VTCHGFGRPIAYPLLTLCRMSKVCEQYSLDDLCAMTEEDMEMLLGFYKPGTVPSLEAVRLQEPDGAYDGPFLI